mmetsp:Transcript_49649/g.124530  ORF Transcript_49649/g.124530 Transcript_49649/m.124530 type:complete len:119 (+) Transcript_49649:437-793(+)
MHAAYVWMSPQSCPPPACLPSLTTRQSTLTKTAPFVAERLIAALHHTPCPAPTSATYTQTRTCVRERRPYAQRDDEIETSRRLVGYPSVGPSNKGKDIRTHDVPWCSQGGREAGRMGM